LQTLPTELLLHTVHFLDSRSAHSLSETCRHLHRTITCNLLYTIEDAEIQSRFETELRGFEHKHQKELRGDEYEYQKGMMRFRQDTKTMKVLLRRLQFLVRMREWSDVMGWEG
jgi:hypothetical protein